jgi:hypothetical protein
MYGMLLSYGATAQGVDPGAVTPPLLRLRAPRADIAVIIRDASERSTTFRQLLARIDATDGLVFVDDGTCGHSVRACLSLSVKVAGPNRLLRITVDARRRDCQLMADIGHELQHAIEVLSDPHVTDMQSAYAFFDREGRTGSDRFETPTALQAGDRVSHECQDYRHTHPLPAPVAEAVRLLGWRGDDVPRIEMVDGRPPDVTATAEAWVRYNGDGSAVPIIYLANDSLVYRDAAAMEYQHLVRLAGILAHERWHMRHGLDEVAAYSAQLSAMADLHANSLYLTEVRLALARVRQQTKKPVPAS